MNVSCDTNYLLTESEVFTGNLKLKPCDIDQSDCEVPTQGRGFVCWCRPLIDLNKALELANRARYIGYKFTQAI